MSDKQNPHKRVIESNNQDNADPAAKRARPSVEYSQSSSPQQGPSDSNVAAVTNVVATTATGVVSTGSAINVCDDADIKTAVEGGLSEKSDDTTSSVSIAEAPSPTPEQLQEWARYAANPLRPAAMFAQYRAQQALLSESTESTNTEPALPSETDSERYEGGDARFVQSDVDLHVEGLQVNANSTEAPGPSVRNVANRVEPDAHPVAEQLDVSMVSAPSSSNENMDDNNGPNPQVDLFNDQSPCFIT